MNLSLVAPGQVTEMIPVMLEHLRTSETWTHGRSRVDHIVGMILSGKMGWWIFWDAERTYGHLITEVTQYPNCKLLTIQHCAVEPNHMAEIDDLADDTMVRFAKDAGCAGIEFVGRPGWRTTAKKYEYEVQSVMYQKFFKEPA